MGGIITTIIVAQKAKWDDNDDNTIYAYDGVWHMSLMLQAVRSDVNHVTKTLSYLSGFSLRGSGRCWLFRVSNFLSILCCSCLPRRLQCARACIDKFLRSLRTH